ncbi:MAG: hypothetical protein GDA67_09795 [Nitrospira sp. CR1.3]|nr:hypothetical protein [Nitrospira sp. CR1.3]
MALMAYRLMMGSDVLRPSTREIRRGQGGLPLYATRQIPEFLENLFEMSFGPQLKPGQGKTPERGNRPKAQVMSPRLVSSGRSLKAILMQMSQFRPSPQVPPQEPGPDQKQLKERVGELESLLKSERALCDAQREELAKLRSRVKRLDSLEGDLTIERESSKQLVDWLQAAEQELADYREFFQALAKEQPEAPPIP